MNPALFDRQVGSPSPLPWRIGEREIAWPSSEDGPDPSWESLPDRIRPLPGRVVVAMDLEPEERSGLVVPLTNRFFEHDGQCRCPFQANSGTVVSCGEPVLMPGDRIVVRPYHGVRFDEYLGCREVAVFGVPEFDHLDADMVAVDFGNGWQLSYDWVCARPLMLDMPIALRNGMLSSVWECLETGPRASIMPGQRFVPTADRRSPKDDCQWFMGRRAPWGDCVVLFRESDWTQGRPVSRIDAVID